MFWDLFEYSNLFAGSSKKSLKNRLKINEPINFNMWVKENNVVRILYIDSENIKYNIDISRRWVMNINEEVDNE